jgi:hypothetical protein
LLLELGVLLNQLVEFAFKLVGDFGPAAASTSESVLLQEVDLPLEFGGDDLDVVLELILAIL